MIAKESSLANSRNRTRILLGIAGIYSLVQIGLYAAAIAQIPCLPADNLMITIMVSYINMLLLSAQLIYVLMKLKLRILGLAFGAFTTAYKLGAVIYLGVVSGKHLGDCYILKNTRNMMISTMSIEIGLLVLLILNVELVRSRIQGLSNTNSSLQNALNPTNGINNTEASSDRPQGEMVKEGLA